ncbi:transcriptional regulator [Chryseobacterium piperi]|uniref:Transcriptional regulator n=1 Tax=Chryseobacterium piperi TaxID=558152 RepID=A0A086BKF4_9FLAO|nr:helix-turn-helix domain-containing protein [Chryseobacterium piperi]ASW72955.1 transcriptional regulator [Chryseobacterium piperi]KFF29418.1 transcriptional regulator [Chryseobacterium piperi]
MYKIKKTSTNFANKETLFVMCPEVYASNIIGGQWSLAICCSLVRGKMRFGEIKKDLPTITERMLTLQLRKLEALQVVTRKVFAEVPPRVEYELTPIGYELAPIIKELENWGKKHKDTVGDIE